MYTRFTLNSMYIYLDCHKISCSACFIVSLLVALLFEVVLQLIYSRLAFARAATCCLFNARAMKLWGVTT